MDIQFKFDFYVYSKSDIDLEPIQLNLAKSTHIPAHNFIFGTNEKDIPNRNGVYSIQIDCDSISNDKRIDITVSSTRLISLFVHGSCEPSKPISYM